MDTKKTKSLEQIEHLMGRVEKESLRHHVLQRAKEFKTSWIGLGQVLYSVWKDKLYRGWGYTTFETYAAKEIGIRTSTALKLLKSYYFLEKEHKRYLNDEYLGSGDAAAVPPYESVDLLRRAKEKKGIEGEELAGLEREVLERGMEPKEVRKELTALMKEREELQPEEAREKKRMAVVKRILGTLKSLHRDAGILKLLPADLLAEIERLAKKLEAHIG